MARSGRAYSGLWPVESRSAFKQAWPGRKKGEKKSAAFGRELRDPRSTPRPRDPRAGLELFVDVLAAGPWLTSGSSGSWTLTPRPRIPGPGSSSSSTSWPRALAVDRRELGILDRRRGRGIPGLELFVDVLAAGPGRRSA